MPDPTPISPGITEAGSTAPTKILGHDAQKIPAAERKLKALQLRKMGASYPKIAVQLGYANPSGARKAVQSAIKGIYSEAAEEVKLLELERLDELILSHWGARSDPRHASIILDCMDRRAKYLGLDAPKKFDITADLRRLAEEHGLDPDEVTREAAQIIKDFQGVGA